MGAGSAINIFKLSLGDDPKEVNNWKLWFAVISFGVMGAGRGIDEGLISGTFDSEGFQNMFHLDELSTADYADVKGNVSAMLQIGCVGGSIIASFAVDRIGRLWATRELCLLWMLGIIIFMTSNGNLGQVYAGRFIGGLGVGQTAVVAPVYLAEVAPKSIRGLCSCVFSGAVYLGIMLAYFATWGSSLHIDPATSRAWQAPTALHIIFSGLILVLSLFNSESPRYLIKKGHKDKAVSQLAYIRNLSPEHVYIQNEIRDIERQLQYEVESSRGAGIKGLLKETFFIPENLYRLYVGLGIQSLGQWSGAGSITVYAQDLFKLVGVSGTNESLYVTVIFGVIKFVVAILCALFLVDMLGRKRALGIGIILQATGLLYLAAFLTAVPQISSDSTTVTVSQKSASVGAIAMIYVSGLGWTIGFNSVQYLISAEIYPLRIRGLCTSIVMVVHFAFQYGSSRAVTEMLLPANEGGLTPGGTFWFFSAITIISGVWCWFFIPEMAGISLEGMEMMFSLRWWQIGRKGRIDQV
ncbi:putative quinate permease [Xylariales sp. PMI_506]|nr:putative quinate permease [Xylariales sp. PMI_506]